MDTVIELEILPGTGPGSYTVHVLRSVGGGEPMSSFTLDLDELIDRRPQLEASILASAVMARRVVPTTEAAIQDVGKRLFDAVFQGDVHTAYRTSLAVASDRGKGIQLVLRLSAPGLVALPWETLFDHETGTYLCRKEPLVRRVPAQHAPAVLTIDPPLRILGMVSSPRGLPALDVEAEKALLEDALRPQIDAGRVKISWVEPVTWSAVHDRLLSREWHVLHFIGHGTYDAETDEGLLAFVGQEGRTHMVPASSLADLIHEADPSPRLVLLNTCSSGTGGRDDLFSGTAGALAQSGIHAVAAMQFEISDRAAIEFSRGFYTALAHGRRIDDAVRSGRIEILGLGQGTLEWVTPVLYLRGDDTRLFDVAPLAETGVVTTGDFPAVPVPVPPPIPPPTPEPAHPHPVVHAADSGDIPSTIIPIIRPDSALTTTGTDASTAPPEADDVIRAAAPPVKPWWADEQTARDAPTKPIPLLSAASPPTGVGPPIEPEPPDPTSDGPNPTRRSKLSRAQRIFVTVLVILAIPLIGTIVAITLNETARPDLAADGSSSPSQTPTVEATEPGTNGNGNPELITVPGVSGKTIDQAIADIGARNLTPATGPGTPENHPTIPEGNVTRTDPAEADQVKPNTLVQFFVSTGMVTVPNLVNNTWEAATTTAAESSLTLVPETGSIGDCGYWGTDRIAEQEPGAPGPAAQGSSITVTYCPP